MQKCLIVLYSASECTGLARIHTFASLPPVGMFIGVRQSKVGGFIYLRIEAILSESGSMCMIACSICSMETDFKDGGKIDFLPFGKASEKDLEGIKAGDDRWILKNLNYPLLNFMAGLEDTA